MGAIHYIVYNIKKNTMIGIYETEDIANDMVNLLCGNNKEHNIKDFKIDKFYYQDINELVTDYYEALKYLGWDNDCDYDEKLGCDINVYYGNMYAALNKLLTIADAWNLGDRFRPNFTNDYQLKWCPEFSYDKRKKQFICKSAINMTNATVMPTRICFKSEERAIQFGQQFIDLWNDILKPKK